MTELEFQQQIQRLIEMYGKEHYKPIRLQVIWGEVKDLPGPWFAKTVSQLIGDSRYPPLLPEFREAIAIERERQASRQKAQHSQDAQDFWTSSLHPDEEKSLFQAIQKRMRGEMGDEEFNAFYKSLLTLARERR